MPTFDNINVGNIAEIEHVVTEIDLARFVELTGDDNRLHTDPEYAARTSFKKPVAHGMLGASFISTVIGTKLPGDGALWFSQNLEFLLPVRVGDRLTVRAEVLRKVDRMHIVELRTEIFNQHRQKVTTGVAKVKVVELDPTRTEETKQKAHVALVVGGSGGIGSAICRSLAQDGFDLAIHYFHNGEEARRLEREATNNANRRAMVIAADISIEDEVAAMIEHVVRRLGTITVLVNCATARIVPVKFENLTWNDFENHLLITVRGAYELVRHVVPVMRSSGYGKIIHISSQAVETPSKEWLPYITAKSALNGFSRALAMDLAPKGIRVNLVSPCMTETEQIADVPERVRLLTAARTPLGRLARPEDVAQAVAFLASERSDYITGETLRVNGGQVML